MKNNKQKSTCYQRSHTAMKISENLWILLSIIQKTNIKQKLSITFAKVAQSLSTEVILGMLPKQKQIPSKWDKHNTYNTAR